MKPMAIVLFAATLSAQDVPDRAKQRMEDAAKKMVDEVTSRTIERTFEYVGGQLVGGNPVKGAPYSAEAVTEMTQTLADGNHIVNRSSSTLYRDSEGRERREESIAKLGAWNAEGEPAKAVFISDPVAKVSYSLDAKAHTAQKMPAPAGVAIDKGKMTIRVSGSVDGQPLVLPPPPPTAGQSHVMVYSESAISTSSTGWTSKSPAKVEHLGTQMIEGIQAEGTRTTVTIPAGQVGNERDINIVSERWYSPELQVTVMSKRSDPRTGESVYKLTNINRSEPLHSMFEIPADYSVTSPKNMHFEVVSKDQDQF
jgi:hypothetical protein